MKHDFYSKARKQYRVAYGYEKNIRAYEEGRRYLSKIPLEERENYVNKQMSVYSEWLKNHRDKLKEIVGRN
jgi:hypothetical protein